MSGLNVIKYNKFVQLNCVEREGMNKMNTKEVIEKLESYDPIVIVDPDGTEKTKKYLKHLSEIGMKSRDGRNDRLLLL